MVEPDRRVIDPAADAPRDPATAVEARDVVKVFGAGEEAFRALDGVSVGIRANEFFTLLGPSGCGKTTLLRLIAGFEFPTEGAIRLAGRDIATEPPYRRPVNTVFQNYALFPHMTVERNVAFGLEMLGRPKAEIERRVGEVLELVRMGELRRRATSEISGGQQQRVALARALAPSPSVLLLDEPLSALDYQLRKEMQIELKRMQHETGITFVFVTHDQEEALTMSDRIAVMSAGRILQVGTPREIYERPADRFVAGFVGETNFLDGTIVPASRVSPGTAVEDPPEAVPGSASETDAGTAEPREASGDGRYTSAETSSVSVRLDTGGTLLAERGGDAPREGRCTLVIRPEHVYLSRAGVAGTGASGHDDDGPEGHDGRLGGTLANVVYSGTDTHHHVTLADGTRFVVRSQNRRSGVASRRGTRRDSDAFRAEEGYPGEGDDEATPREGDAVLVHIEPGVSRVLDERPRAPGPARR